MATQSRPSRGAPRIRRQSLGPRRRHRDGRSDATCHAAGQGTLKFPIRHRTPESGQERAGGAGYLQTFVPTGCYPREGLLFKVFSKKNICMQACPLVGKFANSLPQGPLSAPDFRSSRKSNPSLTTCRTADTGDCSHQKPILGGGGGRCQR